LVRAAPPVHYVFEGTHYPATLHRHRYDRAGYQLAMTVTPFPQLHGSTESTGYRIESAGRALVPPIAVLDSQILTRRWLA
jgi:hypothetical protein